MTRTVQMAQSRKTLGQQIEERRKEAESRRLERAATEFLLSVGLNADGRERDDEPHSIPLVLHCNGPRH